MIKSVTVTNHLGESVTMELRFPEKSGFLIRGIEGLGPSKADINTTEVATYDGAIYNSSRVMSRNIVFQLTYVDKNSIETIRQKSYKYFPIKRRVTIQVESDNRICLTYGYVESNEPNIFSSQEGTVISIVCPDSYFYSLDTMSNAFSAVSPLFEFPFENDSLSEPLLEMGSMVMYSEKQILYEGDASVGMLIYIHALGPASNVEISNALTREKFKIDSERLISLTGSDISQGDDIIISTVKGNKFVYLIRNGAVLNILNTVDSDSDWFQIEKGLNRFFYTAEGDSTNLQIRIENQIAYEGV